MSSNYIYRSAQKYIFKPNEQIENLNVYSPCPSLFRGNVTSLLYSCGFRGGPCVDFSRSGKLDKAFKFTDLTPPIGWQYSDVSLSDILAHQDADDFLRDLAITVSWRGVVLHNQDIDIPKQKTVAQKLGQLSGKPKTSKLHIHPLCNSQRPNGVPDDDVSVISSEEAKNLLQSLKSRDGRGRKKSLAPQWHTE